MRRIIHRVFIVGLLVMAAGGGALSASAQDGSLTKQEREGNEQTGNLDLSAMMLTPLDLADEGLDGYGWRGGTTDTIDDEFLNYISSDDNPPDAVRELLEEAGFVQSRWAYMDLPSEDDPSISARRVTIFIDEYAGDEGLSEVMEVFLDFDGEELEGNETIGDESRIVTYTDITSDTEVEITALVLAFRYENQIVQIEIADFATQLPDIEPAVEEIEALAKLQLDRIEEVRDEGSAGLEHLTFRFESDGEFVFYYDDYYTRLNDQILPRYNQPEAMLEEQDEIDQEFGITDAYRMVQLIGFNGEVGILWNNQVRQFNDDDGAEEWVDAAVEWFELFGIEDAEELDEDLDLGDHAVALTFTDGSDDPDTARHTISIFVQVGDIGLLVQLSYPGEAPDLDTVVELAEMQIACIEDGGCPVESPLPDSVIELAETLS